MQWCLWIHPLATEIFQTMSSFSYSQKLKSCFNHSKVVHIKCSQTSNELAESQRPDVPIDLWWEEKCHCHPLVIFPKLVDRLTTRIYSLSSHSNIIRVQKLLIFTSHIFLIYFLNNGSRTCKTYVRKWLTIVVLCFHPSLFLFSINYR